MLWAFALPGGQLLLLSFWFEFIDFCAAMAELLSEVKRKLQGKSFFFYP